MTVVDKLVHDGVCPGGLEPSALCLAWALAWSRFTDARELTFDTIQTDAPLVTAQFSVSLESNYTVAGSRQTIKRQLEHNHGTDRQDATVCLFVIHDEQKNCSSPDIARYQNQGYEVMALCDIVNIETGSWKIQAWTSNNTLERWRLKRILEQLEDSLHVVHANPNNDLGMASCSLPIRPADKTQIQELNASGYPRVDTCIHDLIHARSQSQAAAPAVCAWDGEFTYEEIDQLSSRLANHLQSLGVAPETYVPLYLRRSRWSPVAILAILKSGGAFVLLDTSHPLDRLKRMCQDVSATLVISSPRDAETAAYLGAPVFTLDVEDEGDMPAAWRAQPVEVSSPVHSRHVAYVAFTSGSSGTPKGFAIEHGQYCTSAAAHAKPWGIDSQARVFQFASYAFDGSIMEMLTTLIEGGCVCIPSEADRQNNLAGAFAAFRATFICLTPSMLKHINHADFPTLDKLLVTGELTPKREIENWAQKVRMTITYGPSECSVACAVQEHVSATTDARNLGRAMGCKLWIVNPRDITSLVPIGAVGEICVEGPTVGRGYVNHPEQTEVAFFEGMPWLSWVQRQTSRVYRTGDLGRYNADGSIYLIGRKDSQTKIRGQRTEVGEIENQIHDSLAGSSSKDVVVEAVRRDRGELILVAFVWDRAKKKPAGHQQKNPPLIDSDDAFWKESQRIKDHLRTRLPLYMIPTVIFPVSGWPLTSSGKTDRRRLRDLVSDLPSDSFARYTTAPGPSAKLQPVSDFERSFRDVVASALGLPADTIGMDDDFFDLGGNSLTAMKLVTLAREQQFAFTVADIFASSILSKILQTAGGEITRLRLKEPAPLSLLKGIEDHTSFVRDVIAPQLPFHGAEDIADVLPATDMQSYVERFPPHYPLVRLHGKVDKLQVKIACKQLVQRHTVLRTVFACHNDQSLQVVLNKVDIPFQYFETAGTIPDFEDAFCRYDGTLRVPTSVPGLAFVLVSRSATEHSLIIRLPLPLCDGESWVVLLHEWMALYQNKSLPPLVTFTAWESQYVSQQNEATFSFWRALLQDSSMTHICDPTIDMPGEEFIFATENIPLLQPPRSITRATLVKTAWALTLAEYTKQTDIIFGQLIHGRAHAYSGEENVAGHLAKIIPIRVQLQSRSTTGLDLLHHVQQQHLASMEFDLVDFHNLVANCTSWPRDTQYGTYVLHQDNEYLGKTPSMGDISVSTCMAYNPVISKAVREFVIMSTPRGKQHEIMICATSVYMDQPAADRLLARMVAKMQMLANVADTVYLAKLADVGP